MSQLPTVEAYDTARRRSVWGEGSGEWKATVGRVLSKHTHTITPHSQMHESRPAGVSANVARAVRRVVAPRKHEKLAVVFVC